MLSRLSTIIPYRSTWLQFLPIRLCHEIGNSKKEGSPIPNENRNLGIAVSFGTMLLFALCSCPTLAYPQEAEIREIGFSERLPYGMQPVDYLGNAHNDAAKQLQGRLADGRQQLEFREPRGYLDSVLRALSIPHASQLLVFSKTARNQRLINPQTPRAIYFNDESSVAWVPGAEALEVMSVDPLKGPIFYTLSQRKVELPRFERRTDCLACHAGSTTLQVPGFMVRSFRTDANGTPIDGYSQVTHDTEYAKRWGGWYVTSGHEVDPHQGNRYGRADEVQEIPPATGDLSKHFDASAYLNTKSDVVAHLILNHQSYGLNLIVRVNYESRLQRKSDAEERLLRYLLFADEAKIEKPIKESTDFQSQFERRGPHDSQKRSLRQLELTTRVFRYRLSYLIYTDVFRALPSDVLQRLFDRLTNILRGKDDTAEWEYLPEEERQAILEIIRDTRAHLPASWALDRVN